MSIDIFKRLTDATTASEATMKNVGVPRWIKRHSEEDAELMAQADILDKCQVTRQLRASLIEHTDKKFLCIVGLDTNEDLPNGIEFVELTPSFFALAVTELNLTPTASALEIIEAIDGSFLGVDDYQGHDLLDIAELFPDVSIYELNPDADFTGSIWRSLGLLLSVFYGQGPIELNDKALLSLKDLYEASSPHVPFRNIVQGHLSMSWSGLFLELYRAIEQLFSVPKLASLTSELVTNKPFFELAEILENRLGWRPKEDDALRDLIEGCNIALIETLAEEFCPEAENKTKGIARAIYKQRNALVHFRQALPEQELSVDQWNTRISAMTKLVSELYGKHGDSYMMPQT